jgi:hypothetical protein
MQGAMNISAQITWTCESAPGALVNGGVCESLGNTGATFTFVPHPPPADTGRTAPLAYKITAKATINGTQQEEYEVLIQDELDQLRQQYHDMNRNQKPERNAFVNAQNYIDPGHFSFEEINSTGTVAGVPLAGDVTTWAIFTVADKLETIRTDIGNRTMPVSDGYRTPIRQLAISAGAPEGNHQYGLAADIRNSEDYNTDGVHVFQDSDDWEYLKAAARPKDACVEPYSDTGSWVHMDWRITQCPDLWK